MTTHTEASRTIPIVEQTDVLVAGGGPAGVAAAVAAARTGAATTLIEAHGCLGGVWTAGLLSWILDAKNKTGIIQELFARLDACDGLSHTYGDGGGGVAADVEKVKFVLERMAGEAGVKIRYHTRIVAAACDASNRMSVAITESKSGREAWAAATFIDCTGDGDLAAHAGCRFEMGRPADGPGSAGPDRAGETQPFSMIALVAGIDPEAVGEFHKRDGRGWNEPKDALQAEFGKFGMTSSYGKPTIFHVRDDLFIWMVNHEYGYNGTNADEVTAATLRSRAELNALIDGLRGLGGPWEKVKLVATAEQIGTREGRRIRGRYTVTVDDMLAGATFDDAVCRVTFGIDVHSTSKSKGTGIEGGKEKGKTRPYEVPLRALIAADCDGLLMAGRCISGDFLAHSSYRVTGNAAAMGQAAGVCAALAARDRVLPRNVPFARVKAGIDAMDEMAGV